ncbi:MAG: glycerate kinase [Calditrichaeota bacterium]|nr:MAG: glycerate kinase [Calditrichota bacterium]MBL1204911.1 glycerate kinase [Calditrichota bacterium]NOG44740.1 glycerate kinase [Calditrichota bacterium]
MNILISPDKFKGSLTASQVCDAVEKGILEKMPSALITKIPLADGGEGSLDALEKTLHFEKIDLKVNNPLFKPIDSFYGLSKDAAYIEMASASGLQLINESERNPLFTSSVGTGEMISDAIKRGAKKIYLFVGGSATNDAGIGIASALGYIFLDENKQKLAPTGSNLKKIKSINQRSAVSFEGIEVNVLTDVKNPLHGKNGAAHVFAAQKGASTSQIKELDSGLKNIAKVIQSTFGVNVSGLPGSGAAGGVGAGAVTFCNAKIQSGIESILDLLHFDKMLQAADWVITGEGLLDKQTLEGKVVKGVADRCEKAGKQVAIVCGDSKLSEADLVKLHTKYIKSIRTKNISKTIAMKNAAAFLTDRSQELIELIKLGK